MPENAGRGEKPKISGDPEEFGLPDHPGRRMKSGMKARTRLHVAVVVSATLLAAPALAQYATGFEAPTFGSGTINLRDSWTSTTPDRARVLTATEIADALTTNGITAGTTVHEGSQALFVSGPGGSSATIRPIGGLTDANVVVLDFWARPLPAGDTASPLGNIFLTMEDAGGVRAAAVRFGSGGGGQTIDYGTAASGTIWQASGSLWDSDSWYRLTLSVNYASDTYDFDLNGTRVNTSPIPFYNAASTNFSQIRIFRGANQAGMIVDSLTVVPEPGLAAFFGLAAAALLARRAGRLS